MFTNYDKALMPLAVGAIIFVLGKFGLTPEMSLQDVVTAVVTAAGVYFVKNKK